MNAARIHDDSQQEQAHARAFTLEELVHLAAGRGARRPDIFKKHLCLVQPFNLLLKALGL